MSKKMDEAVPAHPGPDQMAATPRQGLMPPHVVLRDFLPEETVTGLFDYTLAHEADFAPTRTGYGDKGGVKPHIRISVGTRDLGPFKPMLKSEVLKSVPDLVAKLGTTPVESPKVELELVAHGDGAFYKRHIDTQTARYRDAKRIRVLSCVYYFHAEPKAFSGGALRLYAIGGGGHADIAPERNTLLVFPSWAPHEVMPISCPSQRFADSRFAINCWVHRTKPAPAS